MTRSRKPPQAQPRATNEATPAAKAKAAPRRRPSKPKTAATPGTGARPATGRTAEDAGPSRVISVARPRPLPRTAFPRAKRPATAEAAAAPTEAAVARVEAAVAPVDAAVAPVEAAVAPVEAAASTPETLLALADTAALFAPVPPAAPAEAPETPTAPAPPDRKALRLARIRALASRRNTAIEVVEVESDAIVVQAESVAKQAARAPAAIAVVYEVATPAAVGIADEVASPAAEASPLPAPTAVTHGIAWPGVDVPPAAAEPPPPPAAMTAADRIAGSDAEPVAAEPFVVAEEIASVAGDRFASEEVVEEKAPAVADAVAVIAMIEDPPTAPYAAPVPGATPISELASSAESLFELAPASLESAAPAPALPAGSPVVPGAAPPTSRPLAAVTTRALRPPMIPRPTPRAQASRPAPRPSASASVARWVFSKLRRWAGL